MEMRFSLIQTHKTRLLYFGICLMIVGFYIDKSQFYPALMSIVAPQYSSSKHALDVLEKTGTLNSENPYFISLATVVLGEAAKREPMVTILSVTISRLEIDRPRIAFQKTRVKERVPMIVHFTGKLLPWKWDFIELKEAVEEVRSKTLLGWSVWIFWIGIFIAALMAYADSKGGGTEARLIAEEEGKIQKD